MRRSLQHSGGFSLIELMVSVLIMAIGVLGVLTLQGTSLRGSNGAYFKTQATFIAGDIISRMIANPAAVQSGAYASVDSASPPADPACITTGCTSVQLADQDIREWSQYFTNVLGTANYRATIPGASGTVVATGDVHEVTINWSEVTENGATNQSLTVQTSL